VPRRTFDPRGRVFDVPLQDFLLPLRSEGDKLSRKNIEGMFANIEEINTLNHRFLSELEEALQSDAQNIGETFMRLVCRNAI